MACVQMNAGPDLSDNLQALEAAVREAAAAGARFIATPENSDVIRFPPSAAHVFAKEEDHLGIPLASNLSKELGVALLIGSFSIGLEDTDKHANRSFLFGPDGTLLTRYDKIHLFDVQLPNGESHKESDRIVAGEQAVVADIAINSMTAKLGLSICYDVRFSYLYRDLAKVGADILTVPAAFTVPTGRAHWESLLRARAIETGCFVIAPAQVGDHEGGRRTYGHSLIISPWGEVLAEAGEAPEILYADLVLSHVDKARHAIPALMHDRLYSL